MKQKSLGSWAAILVFIVFTTGEEVEHQVPCTPKDFGESSFVCVCNSSTCDTLPRPILPPEGQYLLYTSDRSSHRFFKTVHSFEDKSDVCRVKHPFVFTPVSGKPAVVADFVLGSKTYQVVMGFGGAISDSAAANVLSLSKAAQDTLLRSYFSKTGLEYNFIRINVGGCDFSPRPYTYADAENDTTLEHFALQPEDTEFKIPLILRAKALSGRPIKLIGSPWTAPPWMKTNNAYVGGGRLKDDMYQLWADYFVKFLKGYGAHGVDVWGMTLQNEPRVGNMPNMNFNCMGWTDIQQAKWLGQYLGPTLEAEGYGKVKLLIMEDTRYELPKWPKTVLSDPAAAKYADGIAIHWYVNNWIGPDKLDLVHQLFPDTFIINTEACEGNFPSQPDVILGSWERAERYAYDIIEDMNHWVNGWLDWNIALDMQGGPNWAKNFVDSSIIVNKDLDEFYKNPMFYAIGHFSKFVQKGAVRHELLSPDIQNLDACGFRNPDGTKVIVMLNKLEREAELVVADEIRGTMRIIAPPKSLQTAFYR